MAYRSQPADVRARGEERALSFGEVGFRPRNTVRGVLGLSLLTAGGVCARERVAAPPYAPLQPQGRGAGGA